jgi:hypothetical protein
VHMTRTILILGVYCSLETPAKSAAEYPHQLHKKPKIFGLYSKPALILLPHSLESDSKILSGYISASLSRSRGKEFRIQNSGVRITTLHLMTLHNLFLLDSDFWLLYSYATTTLFIPNLLDIPNGCIHLWYYLFLRSGRVDLA